MKTAITKGLVGESKKEMEREFDASSLLRRRLTALLLEKTNTRRVKSLSEDEYASPNWAYKQADVVGYERALHEVISLLE